MRLPDGLHAFPWTDPSSNNANTYLIRASKNILLDPGHYHLFGAVRERLARLSLTPEQVDLVIITHAHPDHMEAIRFFSNPPTLIAFPLREREHLRSTEPQYEAALGLTDREPHLLLQEGSLQVGDILFEVFHTPGHSPGSICLYWPEKKVLFTGDVVFHQGIGRTDLPGGDGQELKKSIRRLSRLDVDFLLPGHGEIVQGRQEVLRNFRHIEEMWFPYL